MMDSKFVSRDISRVRQKKNIKNNVLSDEISKIMDRLDIKANTSLVTENKLKGIPTRTNTIVFNTTIDTDDDISLLSNDSSMDGTMYRSVASISSLGSDSSMKSFYTFINKQGNENTLPLREIINSIENRAKNNLKPLGFLPTIESLPINSFSWDKKEYKIKKSRLQIQKPSMIANDKYNLVEKCSGTIEKETDVSPSDNKKLLLNSNFDGCSSITSSVKHSFNRPIVNIIGCNHSIELIIAKADERINKMKDAKRTKKINDEQYSIKLHRSIEQKRLRTERYRQLRIIQQRQAAWMRVISITHFRSKLIILADEIYRLRNLSKQDKSSQVITKAFREWYQIIPVDVTYYLYIVSFF